LWRGASIAILGVLLLTLFVPGCLEKQEGIDHVEGSFFVGAYLNYSLEGFLIQKGHIYMKIIDENETHYKILYEFYAVTFLGTLRNTSIEWEPKETGPFEEQKNWTYDGEEEIVFNKNAVTCQKYIYRDENETATFWVYEGIPIKIEYNESFFLGNLTYTAWLHDTNVIELPGCD